MLLSSPLLATVTMAVFIAWKHLIRCGRLGIAYIKRNQYLCICEEDDEWFFYFLAMQYLSACDAPSCL